MKKSGSLREITQEGNLLERDLGLNMDDVLNKLTQEVGEFNDAVQKYRGRYCKKKADTIKNVVEELGDLVFNLSSICYRLGINSDDFSMFANNTLNKFKMRKELYYGKNLKITICGSIAFYDEMLKVKGELEKKGYMVRLPPLEIKNENGSMISIKEYYRKRKSAGEDEKWIWERKGEAMNSHFGKIEWADAILVLNYDKKGIKNYVGSNTLMEMGLSFFLGKRTYLLNPIPEISSKEEILGMSPTIINRDLSLIK